MSRINYNNYQKGALSKNEHWVFDLCRDGIDNKNVPKEIFDKNSDFNKGVCLRHYYDIIKRQYFPIEDKDNFKYPYLIHGSGRRDNLLLETIIEKCDNKSIITDLLGPCGDKNEMEEYLDVHKAIFFHLLEKQVATDNYKKLINHYLYSISGSLGSVKVPVNNVNLMPFFIELKRGIILPRKETIKTYIFDDNRKTTFDSGENENFLAIFDYWLINSCQVIKGGYNNLYDILPNIGGIIQLIYYIFYIINYFYNQYILVQDCNKLFFKLFNKECEDKGDIHIKKRFSKYVNSIREEIKLKRKNSVLKRKFKIDGKANCIELRGNNNFIGNQKIIKTDINLNKNISNQISNKNEFINNSNIFSNSNELIIDASKNNIIQSPTNINVYNNKKKTLFYNDKYKSYEKNMKNKEELNLNKNNKLDFLNYNFSYQLHEFFFHKSNELKIEPLNPSILSQFISFYNYLLSLLGNENKKRIFFIFNKFREKVLGEENLFRTKIYLYHLEKYFSIKEIEKIDILELYNT